jgi:hypothetical protein
MTKTAQLVAGLAVVLASLLSSNSAFAQNAHSWVSSTGTGTACTRAAPCGAFSTAQTVTDAGGVISVLDPGDYIGFTITKTLTIRAAGVDGGATTINAPGFSAIIIAGASDVVTLEGLHFNGAGLRFITGGQLNVVKCVITNDTVAGTAGIRFTPNSPSKLSVTDTVISNFGLGTGGGIVINPQSGGSARVAFERVTVNGNAFGIAVDGTGSTGGVNMTIADSMIANNAQDGIVATTPSGGAPIGIMVKNTKSVNNALGIRSIGQGVTVRASNSTVTGNGTGLSFSGGGALLSFGNNEVQANGTNGASSGSVGLQ